MIWTVAKKELRGYFNSAVAVLFLAAFLAVTLYTFFWQEKFFARGLADLRPLFQWMPKLLIILAAALAMRLWAEERRAGTLEVLLTLPVPRWKLVLGKFAAGMILIAIGLALTLGLPITVSQMGNLDGGPVLGGYLAALLLSGAYLSIGMCVSALTDNQIVAFVGTAFACALAYVVGGDGSSELQRALGTGVRFESVARGVLDLRDLAYYGGIMVTGIALNVLLLGIPTWGRGPRARPRRQGAILAVVLVAANAIALNVWLQPVSRARIDLTDGGLYSLSSATESMVRGLDERLVIHAYFSDKTHPLLAPLIPQIRDLLDEYRAAGSKVEVEFVDPSHAPDAARDAKDRFNISAAQLPFSTATEKSVVNAYFSIAIEYGDQFEVLGLNDLIQVRANDVNDVDVSLVNLEYQITKSIKKVVSGFSSIDSLFAAAPGQVKLTAYITPKTLPDNWKAGPEQLKKVTEALIKESKGKLSVSVVEPKLGGPLRTDAERQAAEAEANDLARRYGITPFSPFLSNTYYYFHFLIEVGNRAAPVVPPEELSEPSLRIAIIDGLKRAAPGFRKVVGLWSPPAMAPMQMQGMPPQQMPPPQSFERLQRALAGAYEVRAVNLQARVPDDIDALVLAGPANLDAKAVEYVDQFVMRGGSLVVLAGRFRIAMGQGLAIEPVTTGLEAVLDKWGVKVLDEVVLDTKSMKFATPENKELGNGVFTREIVFKPYAMFVKVSGGQLDTSSVITSGLAGAVMAWASPVIAQTKVGEDEHRVDELLRTSSKAWTTKSTQAEPSWKTYPDTGLPPPAKDDDRAERVLAVAISGGFASGVAKAKPEPAADGTPPPAPAQRLLEHSPPDTRIVVFGSSAFVSDDVLAAAQQLDSDLVLSNTTMVQNAVDWALADLELLSIRGNNSAARALTVEEDAREGWRTANIVIAALGLLAIVGAALLLRRAVKPFVTAKEV